MDNKDAFQAAKILIDFIRDFTFLTEQQLMSIRRMMEDTVQCAMTSVQAISAKADAKKSSATEIMVRDDASAELRYSATKIKEEQEQLSQISMDKKREFLENQLRRSGGVFSKHMEALHTMDHELQDILFKMTGTLSMDDVMGQRLTHVIQALYLLKEGLSEVISNYPQCLQVKKIKHLRNRLLTEVYRSFTSEEEKEVFHKIFGHPREAHRAS